VVIQQAHQRQERHIELIASENDISPALMTA
jgi:glycine/serine hydroxymethyltransferase